MSDIDEPAPDEDDWSAEYFEDEDYEEFNLEFLGPETTSRQVSRVMNWLELPAGARVLDLGCGAGRHTHELLRRGVRPLGLDRSAFQLEKALRRAPDPLNRASFVRADGRWLPLRDGSFDAVLSLFNSFGYFSDEDNREVLYEVARVLRPGGRLMLDVLNRDAFLLHQGERTWDRTRRGLVLQEMEYQVWTSQLRTVWRHVREDGSEQTRTTWNRLYSAHELVSLCNEVGLIVDDISDGEVRGYFNWRHSHTVMLTARKEESWSS